MSRAIALIASTFVKNKIMAKHIKTFITINASKEEIWNVLTNFKKFPEWNPFTGFLPGGTSTEKEIMTLATQRNSNTNPAVWQGGSS